MILHCGAHCSRLFRNGSHMSTHTASILFLCDLPTGCERNRPASPSSAPCRTTAARPSPDCTPPSETYPSYPYRSHRRPSAATVVAAVWFPIAQGTADRSPVPCSLPTPRVGLLAAPPHSRTPVPPHPRIACCRAPCL